LFFQYSEKLFNMAYRRLNDVEKAYDAVSETFVIASQKS
jgi:DNA-directed RNA polymerase specialized sigma24 family protein